MSREQTDIRATDVVRIGKSRTHWIVQEVDGDDVRVFIQHPGRRLRKIVTLADVTLVHKGLRHTDFHRG